MKIAAYHQTQEEFTEAWLAQHQTEGKSIFCQRGCAGCCNLAVHTTYPEGEHIAEELCPEQQTRLQHYIDGLKGYSSELTDLKHYLKQHRRQLGPCPFLDAEGTCSVYQQRPLSCRALLSTRPAEWCTVDFGTLSEWDKCVYEGGLDKTVVAWPTHFVAATQDRARTLEAEIISDMQKQRGWVLTGNLPLMVWLAVHLRNTRLPDSPERVREILAENGLDSELLVTLNDTRPRQREKR